MRREEENYIEVLSNLSMRHLKSQVGDRQCNIHKQSEEYFNVVESMTNSYIFHPDEVLDVICKDASLTGMFRLFALSWIEAMGMQYTEDYWDERDKAAVEYCHRITKMNSFRSIYDRLFKTAYEGNDYLSCKKTDMVLYVYTARIMGKLHHTLRQSFTGFVLSFVIRDEYLRKIKVEAGKMGIFSKEQKRVQFLMI